MPRQNNISLRLVLQTVAFWEYRILRFSNRVLLLVLMIFLQRQSVQHLLGMPSSPFIPCRITPVDLTVTTLIRRFCLPMVVAGSPRSKSHINSTITTHWTGVAILRTTIALSL